MITKIWINNGWRKIAPTDPIRSTRALYSFCMSNNLSNNIIKSQGEYYLITPDGIMHFIERTLYNITFQKVYELCGQLLKV